MLQIISKQFHRYLYDTNSRCDRLPREVGCIDKMIRIQLQDITHLIIRFLFFQDGI